MFVSFNVRKEKSDYQQTSFNNFILTLKFFRFLKGSKQLRVAFFGSEGFYLHHRVT